MIAFFGMGLLGSNFVRALRRRGEDVHVWNRSPDKATALEAEGARAFADPAEAARGAARIHLTLPDDTVVDDVLERARPGLAADVILVDHSTTSTQGVVARIARWRDRGITFVHAPVFMGPQNARDATGIMMVSGPRSVVDPLRPVLAPMTGKLVDLGERPDGAAAFKLLGNLFLMCMTAGLAEMLALARPWTCRRPGRALFRSVQSGHDDRPADQADGRRELCGPVLGAHDGAQGRPADARRRRGGRRSARAASRDRGAHGRCDRRGSRREGLDRDRQGRGRLMSQRANVPSSRP